MPSDPKIRFFLIILLLVISLNSCNKEKNDVIPYTYVNFTIDLNDYPNLSTITGSDTVNENDLRIVIGRNNAGGFNGNGIIIYCHEYGFYAFDRTCPFDYANNNKSVKVKLDGIFAICPKCGTTYALPNNGMPYSGPGRNYLKEYQTSFTGRYVMVWNN